MIALHNPQEARVPDDLTLPPQLAPESPQEAPQRRRAPSTWRERAASILSRETQRSARLHAEEWWQTLRDPHTITRSALVSSPGPQRQGGRMQVVGVGQSGGVPAAGLPVEYAHTPVGLVSAAHLHRVADQHRPADLGPRAHTRLSLLTQEGTFTSPRLPALRCAVFALTVAVAVGDTGAVVYLEVLRAVEEQAEDD